MNILNRINLSNKKVRYGLAISGILIFFVILFVVFSYKSVKKISQQKYLTLTSTSDLKWETSKQLIEEGKIPQPSKILEVDLSYNQSKNPKLTVDGLAEKNGYVPSILIDPNPYVIQLLDVNQEIIYQQQFNLPDKENYDYPDSQGKLHGGIVSLSKFSFAETLPWFQNIKQIRILDEKGQIVMSETSLKVKVINNNLNFHGITGDQALNTSNKLNLNIFQPQKALAATSKSLIIAFVSNGYTDLGAFHTDEQSFFDTLLTFEPYKTRASQVTFITVDNQMDLQCAADSNVARMPTCNNQLVTQAVNNAGAPYTGINVIYNTLTYGGSSGGSISVEYNGSWGPVVFVHEFGGHTFGRLLDEYAYAGEASNGYLDNQVHNLDGVATGDDGNCYGGNPPASAWNGVVASGDYNQGCGAWDLNWYGSAKSSIMLAINDNSFDPISQQMINRRLDALAGSYGGQTSILNPTSTPGRSNQNIIYVTPVMNCIVANGGNCLTMPSGSSDISGNLSPAPMQVNNSGIKQQNVISVIVDFCRSLIKF